MGTVNAVVPHAELENTALDWAETILGKSPTSIRMLKFSLNAIDDVLAGQPVLVGVETRRASRTRESVGGAAGWLGAYAALGGLWSGDCGYRIGRAGCGEGR